MSFASLSGPRMPPASGAKAEQLIVLLHGYGSDGNDLIGLAPHLGRALPGAAFVAPNGPQPTGQGGYQWFDLMSRAPQAMIEGARRAQPAIEKFVDGELERLGLGDERLAFVGFSQGTMMSLHVALRRPRTCAAVVGFSGALISPELLKTECRAKPPILLIHGDADDMLPVQSMFAAAQGLAAAEIAAEWHVCHGVPHGIDPGGLDLATRFLRQMLRRPI
jgi:phospholipase/carboxylesterase